MTTSNLTASRLRELLLYSPETGEFTWLQTKGSRALVGEVAGHLRKSDGYFVVRVDGKIHKAHRLACLYTYGKWPKADIDHKDGNRAKITVSRT